jgi:hypothetical protein
LEELHNPVLAAEGVDDRHDATVAQLFKISVHRKLTERPLFKIFSEGRNYCRKVAIMQSKYHRRFSFQLTFRNWVHPSDAHPDPC